MACDCTDTTQGVALGLHRSCTEAMVSGATLIVVGCKILCSLPLFNYQAHTKKPRLPAGKRGLSMLNAYLILPHLQCRTDRGQPGYDHSFRKR